MRQLSFLLPFPFKNAFKAINVLGLTMAEVASPYFIKFNSLTVRKMIQFYLTTSASTFPCF